MDIFFFIFCLFGLSLIAAVVSIALFWLELPQNGIERALVAISRKLDRWLFKILDIIIGKG